MDERRVPPTRMRTAIAVSIVIHLCALTALVFVNPSRLVPDPGTDEAPVFRVATSVRHRWPPRRPVKPVAIVPVPRRIAVRPVPKPARLALPVRVRQPAPALLQARKTGALGPPVHARSRPPTNPDVVGDPRAVAVAPMPTLINSTPAQATPTPEPATPTPAPTPQMSPTSSPPLPQSFGGLFSQNYPPTLPAASIVANARAHLVGHGRIRVAIDETGHATDVRITGPGGTDAAAQDVRAALLGASYVPADCNGLPCEGTLEITY